MKNVTLERERSYLCPQAFHTADTKGRLHPIGDCPVRTDFQRDRDRITHSKAFRRLMNKMQVFISPEGDHYRTRLTHTLEVTQIARTLARAMCLNEDLTEAAALGHDLGHTPFGHSGEKALDFIMPCGFRHYEQSLRVVDRLEAGGKGLNLTFEVRDGILNHSGSNKACTLEGQLIKYADRIAYLNHDIDDAVRAGLLDKDDIPRDICDVLGNTHSERITSMVTAVIANGVDKGEIGMTEPEGQAMMDLRAFMFDRVYGHRDARSEDAKVLGLMQSLFDYYLSHTDKLPDELKGIIETDGIERAVCDHLAGMTDRFAISTYENLFVPRVWPSYKTNQQ